MNSRRLEVVLPADVPERDCVTVAHAIWAVLDSVGLGEGSSVREVIDESENGSSAPLETI